MNADGSNQQALTNPTTNTQDTQSAWSPDGSKIAFVSTRDSTTETWQETDDDGNYITKSKLHINKEIYVMNADGSGQARLTNDPANDDLPSWSPIGLTILFRSDRERDCCDPTAQIWSMNADGTAPINLSSNNSGDSNGSGTMIDSSDNAAKDGSSNFVDSSASLVIVNFDSLPTNVAVTNQYPQATFSSYPGGVVSTAFDCSFLGSCPNGIIATSGIGSTYWPNADVYVNFTVPVNGLTFRVLGGQSGGAAGQIDVYANNAYFGTVSFFTGTGFPGQVLPPVIVNLSAVQHITAIKIRNVDNCSDLLCIFHLPVYYDDFAFTPELSVNITSPRASGNIDSTTKNALLGADVSLTASGSIAGGTYSWTYSGPVAGGSQTGASTTIQSTDTSDHGGPITAKVTYTLHGVSVATTVTINSILPTLTSFTGREVGDLVTQGPQPGMFDPCGDVFPFWLYRLGCGAQNEGMSFDARVQAPSTFISDPSKSGIKYVQAISTFRKKVQGGNLLCNTIRSGLDPANVASGWQLDSTDPYSSKSVHFFSEGNDLSIHSSDSPDHALTAILDNDMNDALYIDDQFEMYVVYFAGNPASPNPGSQRTFAKIPWSWGGLVVFDEPGQHRIRSTLTIAGPKTSVRTSSMVSMDGNVKSDPWVPCAGAPLPTNNLIDGSRVFVRFHYKDFLGRDPDGNPDEPFDFQNTDLPGWKFWTSQISKCAFDLNCIHVQRVNDGLAFFLSGEFIQTDPDLANPPGSPNFNPAVYNRAFVK